MTVEECYDHMGADYKGVIRRLISEDRVKKYLQMFTRDESYSNFCNALKNDNGEEAFRAAHSMKGISANLGLTGLLNASGALTEELREHVITQNARSLAGQLNDEYRITVENIRQLMQL